MELPGEGARTHAPFRALAARRRALVITLLALGFLGPLLACRPAPTIFEAIEAGDSQSIAEMLTNGIDPNVEDAMGETPLLRAVEQRRGKIVETLLEAGANVDSVDRERNTPLMVSIRNGDSAISKRLLSARADVNHQNIEGESPLILVAAHGDNRTLLYLLQAGADLGLENAIEENALEVATRNGNTLSAEILRAVSGELPPASLSPPAALAFWTFRARTLLLINEVLFDNLSDGVVSSLDYDRVDAVYRAAIHLGREELTQAIGALREAIETVYTTQPPTQSEREYSKDYHAQWDSPKKTELDSGQVRTIARSLVFLVLMGVGFILMLGKVAHNIRQSILYSRVRSRGGDPVAALSREQPDSSPVSPEELTRLRTQSSLTAMFIMLAIFAVVFLVLMAAVGGFG